MDKQCCLSVVSRARHLRYRTLCGVNNQIVCLRQASNTACASGPKCCPWAERRLSMTCDEGRPRPGLQSPYPFCFGVGSQRHRPAWPAQSATCRRGPPPWQPYSSRRLLQEPLLRPSEVLVGWRHGLRLRHHLRVME